MTDRQAPQVLDQQAIATLEAARDVANSIARFQRVLLDPAAPRARRRRVEGDLLEASERLCNLLGLLTSWLEKVPATDRTPLEQAINELRGKLIATGAKLIGDKTQRLIDQAARVVSGEIAFPVGISARLGDALAALLGATEALGGVPAMPADVGAKVIEAERLIARLREMDAEFGLTRDIRDLPPA